MGEELNFLKGKELTGELLRKEFLNHTFLVVEDEDWESGPIITSIRKERGLAESQQDQGVILVTNYEDCIKTLESLLSKDGPNNLIVILDIRIPRSPSDQTLRNFGDDILLKLEDKISELKRQSSNRQISIIFNSSLIKDQEKALRLGGVGFSPVKKEVVSVVKEFLKKKT